MLGERVWVNRGQVPVPPHHTRVPVLLNIAGLVGAVCLMVGLVLLHPWMTTLGFVLAFGAKLWFADRMVWLYADMMHVTPEYRSWLF